MIGFDPNLDDTRLQGITERARFSGISSQAVNEVETEIIAAVADSHIGRLIVRGSAGFERKPPDFTDAIETIRTPGAVELLFSGIKSPSLWRDPTFQEVIVDAWRAGVLSLAFVSNSNVSTISTPVGLLPILITQCKPEREGDTDTPIVRVCVDRLFGSKPSNAYAALVKAAYPGSAPSTPKEALDRVLTLMDLARSSQLRSPDAVPSCSLDHEQTWISCEEKLSTLTRPHNLLRELSPLIDSSRQLLVGVNSATRVKDILAIQLLTHTTLVFLYPLSTPIAVFRYESSTSASTRQAAEDFLKLFMGNGPGALFHAVGRDAPMTNKRSGLPRDDEPRTAH